MGAFCTRYGTAALVYGNFGGGNYSGGTVQCGDGSAAAYARWMTSTNAVQPISAPDYIYKLHDIEYGLAQTRADVRRADRTLADRLRRASLYMDWTDYLFTRLVALLFATMAHLDIQVYHIGKAECRVKTDVKPRMESMHAQTERDFNLYVQRWIAEHGLPIS